jgi:glycosyltransferase involved in cell wall biosynthesis
MPKKLNIVMLSSHACIRVHKMAIPLMEEGHDVHLVARKLSSFWQQYKSFILCEDIEQFSEAVKLHAPRADIFHCHNEPSWFVTLVKEITNKPVILDVHDSYLARSTPEEAQEALDRGDKHVRVSVEERTNCQLADGLIFPGDDFRQIVTGEFKLQQPTLTLPSYVPKRYFQYDFKDWHGGLVYEGKVNLPKETTGYSSGFRYCDYTNACEATTDLGMDFHLYAGRDDEAFKKHYSFEHTFVHEPLNYEALMGRIGRHDWGLVGNTTKTREWDVAMPNKMFEYMASGVPVVAMNAAQCAKFVDGAGVGISVEGPQELADRWREHRDARKRVIKERQAWSMNYHIHKLEQFYEDVRAAA